MRDVFTVHLTGGLGNQLFQFAAALSCQDAQIEIETELGRPRGDHNKRPDLFAFKLPQNVVIAEHGSKLSFLAGKATGYALRSAVEPKGMEKIKFVGSVSEFAVSVILYFRTGVFYRISRGFGVGFSRIRKLPKNQYLIGYFQSYKFAAQCLTKLKSLEPLCIGPELAMLMTISEKEKPLVVHFRLGDYLNEPNFGIPGREYYETAIDSTWSTGNYKTIWVFSDDIPHAQEIFPKELLRHVRWIDNVDNSPTATLQAMRFGRGYIIANSTFSWWGAYLSMTENAPVYAPSPWFKGMGSPEDLLPPHWKIVDSNF
jgi:hypothetical protein